MESGHIVVGVTVADPGSGHLVQHGVEPFLWPEERDAEERAERERFERMRVARLVDGRDIRYWSEDVNALKRAGRYDEAARLLRRLLDAEDAAAAIIDTPPLSWITQQAAIVFRWLGDFESEVAVLQRYLAQYPPGSGPATMTARLARARTLLDNSTRTRPRRVPGGPATI
ncbi:tetratricopeptide repeat protein [Nocardia niigatensis]